MGLWLVYHICLAAQETNKRNVTDQIFIMIDYQNIQLFSMGGSGSHFLGRWLYYLVEDQSIDFLYNVKGRGFAYKHQSSPPQELVLGNAITIYTYCIPFNHALGMYGKNQPFAHCKQMGGRVKKLKQYPTFESFVENGVDYFGYFNHLNNWLNVKTPYRRILIKYEYLESELENLLNLLGLKMIKPPVFRPRRTDYNKLEEAVKRKLMYMFDREYSLYKHIPPLILV